MNNKILYNKIAKGVVSFAAIILLLSSILATSLYYNNNITANAVREAESEYGHILVTEVDELQGLSYLNEGWYEIRSGFVFYLDTFNSYVPLYIKILNQEQQNGLLAIDEYGAMEFGTVVNLLKEKEVVDKDEAVQNKITGNAVGLEKVTGFASQDRKVQMTYTNPSQVTKAKIINEVKRQEPDPVRQQQLIPKAVAIAGVESGYNQKAISRRTDIKTSKTEILGIGIFQLNPSTAKSLGVDPYNEDQNIKGGIAYLREQLNNFNNPTLAYAAFNAGPNAVKKNGVLTGEENQKFVTRVAVYEKLWVENPDLQGTYLATYYQPSLVSSLNDISVTGLTLVRQYTVAERIVNLNPLRPAIAEAAPNIPQNFVIKAAGSTEVAQLAKEEKAVERPKLEGLKPGTQVYYNGELDTYVGQGPDFYSLSSGISAPLNDPRLSTAPPAFSTPGAFASSRIARLNEIYTITEDGKVQDEKKRVIGQLNGNFDDLKNQEIMLKLITTRARIGTRDDILSYEIEKISKEQQKIEASKPDEILRNEYGDILSIGGKSAILKEVTYVVPDIIVDGSIDYNLGAIYESDGNYYLDKPGLEKPIAVNVQTNGDGKQIFVWKDNKNGEFYGLIDGKLQVYKGKEKDAGWYSSVYDPRFAQKIDGVNKKEIEGLAKVLPEAAAESATQSISKFSDLKIGDLIDGQKITEIRPEAGQISIFVEGSKEPRARVNPNEEIGTVFKVTKPAEVPAIVAPPAPESTTEEVGLSKPPREEQQPTPAPKPEEITKGEAQKEAEPPAPVVPPPTETAGQDIEVPKELLPPSVVGHPIGVILGVPIEDSQDAYNARVIAETKSRGAFNVGPKEYRFEGNNIDDLKLVEIKKPLGISWLGYFNRDVPTEEAKDILAGHLSEKEALKSTEKKAEAEPPIVQEAKPKEKETVASAPPSPSAEKESEFRWYNPLTWLKKEYKPSTPEPQKSETAPIAKITSRQEAEAKINDLERQIEEKEKSGTGLQETNYLRIEIDRLKNTAPPSPELEKLLEASGSNLNEIATVFRINVNEIKRQDISDWLLNYKPLKEGYEYRISDENKEPQIYAVGAKEPVQDSDRPNLFRDVKLTAKATSSVLIPPAPSAAPQVPQQDLQIQTVATSISNSFNPSNPGPNQVIRDKYGNQLVFENGKWVGGKEEGTTYDYKPEDIRAGLGTDFFPITLTKATLSTVQFRAGTVLQGGGVDQKNAEDIRINADGTATGLQSQNTYVLKGSEWVVKSSDNVPVPQTGSILSYENPSVKQAFWSLGFGYYDSTTKSIIIQKQDVMAFQKRYGLAQDGVVGPLTVAKINEVLESERKLQEPAQIVQESAPSLPVATNQVPKVEYITNDLNYEIVALINGKEAEPIVPTYTPPATDEKEFKYHLSQIYKQDGQLYLVKPDSKDAIKVEFKNDAYQWHDPKIQADYRFKDNKVLEVYDTDSGKWMISYFDPNFNKPIGGVTKTEVSPPATATPPTAGTSQHLSETVKNIASETINKRAQDLARKANRESPTQEDIENAKRNYLSSLQGSSANVQALTNFVQNEYKYSLGVPSPSTPPPPKPTSLEISKLTKTTSKIGQYEIYTDQASLPYIDLGQGEFASLKTIVGTNYYAYDGADGKTYVVSEKGEIFNEQTEGNTRKIRYVDEKGVNYDVQITGKEAKFVSAGGSELSVENLKYIAKEYSETDFSNIVTQIKGITGINDLQLIATQQRALTEPIPSTIPSLIPTVPSLQGEAIDPSKIKINPAIVPGAALMPSAGEQKTQLPPSVTGQRPIHQNYVQMPDKSILSVKVYQSDSPDFVYGGQFKIENGKEVLQKQFLLHKSQTDKINWAQWNGDLTAIPLQGGGFRNAKLCAENSCSFTDFIQVKDKPRQEIETSIKLGAGGMTLEKNVVEKTGGVETKNIFFDSVSGVTRTIAGTGDKRTVSFEIKDKDGTRKIDVDPSVYDAVKSKNPRDDNVINYFFGEAAKQGFSRLDKDSLKDYQDGLGYIGDLKGKHIILLDSGKIATKQGDTLLGFIDREKGLSATVQGPAIIDPNTKNYVLQSGGTAFVDQRTFDGALTSKRVEQQSKDSFTKVEYFDGKQVTYFGATASVNGKEYTITPISDRNNQLYGYLELNPKDGGATLYLSTGEPNIWNPFGGGNVYKKGSDGKLEKVDDKEAIAVRNAMDAERQNRNLPTFEQVSSQRFFANVDRVLTDFQGFGYYATLFFDEDSLLKWRDNVDRTFATFYLGTEYWSSAICGEYLDGEDDGIAYAETPQGLAQVAAHVEATRTEPILTPTGEEFIYKITFNVRNGDYNNDPRAPEEMHVNVILRGEKTVPIFKEEQKVKRGSSFGRTGRNAIVQDSTVFYTEICLTFDKTPLRWKVSNNEVCNTIVESSGAPTTVAAAASTTSSQGSGAVEGDVNDF